MKDIRAIIAAEHLHRRYVDTKANKHSGLLFKDYGLGLYGMYEFRKRIKAYFNGRC